MDAHRQHHLDAKIESNKAAFLKYILSDCRDKQEAVYVTCSLALDYLMMHHKALLNAVPSQEAKAALKVTLDLFLVNHGMSVAIHEFE